MSTASLRARYLDDTVTNASPQRLLVRLHDRLALDLELGHAALTAGDRAAATEQLQHAQDVVFGLLEGLQIDAWEGAPRLAALYNWLISELGHAIIKGDLRRVADCRKIVEPLRDAWREAAASLASAPA